MRKALGLAAKGEGLTRPNPPVGAVLVRGGAAVGQGYHSEAGGAHAEVKAIEEAGVSARKATLYVTLEPCSTRGKTGPCTQAILDAGISRVVCSVRDPNPSHRGRGLTMLRRRGLQVTEGVCAEIADRLIEPFRKWISTGRPYVTLKMAMTLDGRIADARGKSRWITGEKARRRVHALRDRVDAVMVGARTACLDDPSLLGKRRTRVPYRVVLDSHGSLPVGAQVLSDGHEASTIVATTRRCPPARRKVYRDRGARVCVLPSARGRVRLESLLDELGERGCLHVLSEGGGEMAASLIAEELVDELLVFVAPLVVGGGGKPVVGGTGWRLDEAPGFRLVETRRVGDDVLLRLLPEPRISHPASGS